MAGQITYGHYGNLLLTIKLKAPLGAFFSLSEAISFYANKFVLRIQYIVSRKSGDFWNQY